MTERRIHVANCYSSLHNNRIQLSIDALAAMGAQEVVELGGHPWEMTRALISAGLDVLATVSAEEVLLWPDEIDVKVSQNKFETTVGEEVTVPNYSANLERTRFPIDERPDTVIACEIIEHLVRAPHLLLLNANDWLPVGGKLLITTPNGLQFQNPLRRKPRMNAYRAHIYERHTYLFSLAALVELTSLCGFRVVKTEYWNAYARNGAAKLYNVARRIPGKWFKDKFSRTCVVVAEKTASVTELARVPSCYAPSDDWEYIEAGSRR